MKSTKGEKKERSRSGNASRNGTHLNRTRGGRSTKEQIQIWEGEVSEVSSSSSALFSHSTLFLSVSCTTFSLSPFASGGSEALAQTVHKGRNGGW